MTAPTWIALAEIALSVAAEVGKRLGLDPPDPDELKSAVNDHLEKVIPGMAAALGVFGVVNAAATIASIDSLPEDPKCPRCGAVVRRWVSFNPATHAKTERQACDVVACGWKS